ncbi:alpha/beta hydrolase [Spirillospora sp. NPDC047279]|uniref:PGAP1-like alpha/beta domain-containing protein n=1 Tax=Spirillospora sp. NPDC047279 TaxID=3155478 RepID=UPI0033DD17F5
MAAGSLSGVAGAAWSSPSDPIVVIGGIDAHQSSLDAMTVALRAQGFRAFPMQLSGRPPGVAPIPESAQAVADKVAEVRKETGSSRVSLVGHSMGGLAARHYLKFLGGQGQVSTYVSVGTPHRGEWLGVLCAVLSQGCRDLLPTSTFIRRLNEGPPIPRPVDAFHIYSDQGTGEKRPLAGATNIRIQSFCPGRTVSHADELVDRAVQELVTSALQTGAPATNCPQR